MTRLEAISVLIGGNTAVDLTVEEFHPYDPAAYVVDPGWTAYDSNGVEYFVNQCGDVFRQPENESVGIAPVIAGECDRREAEFEVEWNAWEDF
jgi:hypothetical protein